MNEDYVLEDMKPEKLLAFPQLRSWGMHLAERVENCTSIPRNSHLSTRDPRMIKFLIDTIEQEKWEKKGAEHENKMRLFYTYWLQNFLEHVFADLVRIATVVYRYGKVE